ncbi:MAG: hypothetical protein KDB53_01740, partial [Planctomycetes bacterium]|nr:hypothetical protein [Planctomycetota bacterium]
LVLAEDPEPSVERREPLVSEIVEHVPDLGPVGAIREVDEDLIQSFVRRLLRRRLDQRLDRLAVIRELSAAHDALAAASVATGGAKEGSSLTRLRDLDTETLVKTNTAVIARYHEHLGRLRSEAAKLEAKDALIGNLAGFVEELRRALASVFVDQPDFKVVESKLPSIPEHVPGLGDLETAQSVNRKVAREALAEFRRLREQLDAMKSPLDEAVELPTDAPAEDAPAPDA